MLQRDLQIIVKKCSDLEKKPDHFEAKELSNTPNLDVSVFNFGRATLNIV